MGNLILIGFMGCGKSTLGVKLSEKLHKTFLDTDEQIEKQQGISIRELFASQGEEAFRNLETEVLKELLAEKTELVLSTGGGMILREENRSLLKKLGTVVYLKVSPKTVYERLKTDTTRPLLQGANPLLKIENLMKDRKMMYEDAAQIVIEADGKGVEELIEEICLKTEK